MHSLWSSLIIGYAHNHLSCTLLWSQKIDFSLFTQTFPLVARYAHFQIVYHINLSPFKTHLIEISNNSIQIPANNHDRSFHLLNHEFKFYICVQIWLNWEARVNLSPYQSICIDITECLLIYVVFQMFSLKQYNVRQLHCETVPFWAFSLQL